MKKLISLSIVSLLAVTGCNNGDTKERTVDFVNSSIIKNNGSTPGVVNVSELSDVYSVRVAESGSDRLSFLEKSISTKETISEFNQNVLRNRTLTKDKRIFKSLKTEAVEVGDVKMFYMDPDGNQAKEATLVATTGTVEVLNGNRNLKIWVANDSLSGNTCKKENCITEAMASRLLESFLKPGLDNDIYDKVTNLIGEEWGQTNYNELINKTDQINILLVDIKDDGLLNNGVIGFFHGKDVFLKSEYAGSNEMNMFYIDSQMFGNNTVEWDNEIKSTLIHEFQHMISFYQRNLLRHLYTPVWIEEMKSMTMEDYMSNYFKLRGPRGVNSPVGSMDPTIDFRGIYSFYLDRPRMSMDIWTSVINDYSKVSLLGGYLIRNTSDIKEFYKGLTETHYLDERMISEAWNKDNNTDKTFKEIYSDFGAAILLSDSYQEVPYRLNSGDWIHTDSGVKLGSIDVFMNLNLNNKIEDGYGIKNIYTLKKVNFKGDLNIDSKEILVVKVR